MLYIQQLLGCTDKPITDILSIGIGGSDLGPRMVTEALAAYHVEGIKVHYVANVDGADLHAQLSSLNPETSLILVASKSFSTTETLLNANTVREWFDQFCRARFLDMDNCIEKHFVAITANTAANRFWYYRGEHFSYVGLGWWSLLSMVCNRLAHCVSHRYANFHALLAGANGMDQHFREQAYLQNMPVVAALLEYWYAQYWDTRSRAIIPYAQYLHRFRFFTAIRHGEFR